MLAKRFFGFIGERFRAVLHINHLAAFFVLGSVLLGITLHLFNFFLAQTAGVLHGDLAFLARGLVLGGDGKDAVHVDIERHLDLRNAARRRRHAFEIERPEQSIVPGEFALALQDIDRNSALIVRRRGERLRLACRYSRIPRNQRGHHAAECFDAE